MGKFIDLTGLRVNRLTVILPVGTRPPGFKMFWLCVCDCPERNTVIVASDKLRSGHTQSCGCKGAEGRLRASTKHGHARKGKNTSEYTTWINAKHRCNDPIYEHYERYGGRGISMCERWLNSFENFLADMGTKPTPKHSLDRINNDGNYEPRNCRWATHRIQMKNRDKPSNTLLTAEIVSEIKRRLRAGESQQSIADLYSVTQTTISRINLGKRWKEVR